MAHINIGTFKGDTYTKVVRFSKAVLWKDRQISLNAAITAHFKPKGIMKVVFEDPVKNERWVATVEALRKVAVLKKEGQERQFYFPISVFKKEPIDPSKVKEAPADALVLEEEELPSKDEIAEHERKMQEIWDSL